MNRMTITAASAVGGIVSFLALIVLQIMTDTHVHDVVASVFWLGIVGFALSLSYGIPVSLFTDWMLMKMNIQSRAVCHGLFILSLVLFGTIIPILGNLVGFLFAITYLLLVNGKYKPVLFINLCALFLITSGIILEVNSGNMTFTNMTPFFVLYGAGTLVIAVFVFLLFDGTNKRKTMITSLSVLLVFLPSSIHLVYEHHQFETQYQQKPEIAHVYDLLNQTDYGLEVDLIGSFENGDYLDLTIHKHTDGFVSREIERVTELIPERSGGYYLQIYAEEEYLYLTLDSENGLIECEHVSAPESVCEKLEHVSQTRQFKDRNKD
ncbi:hypothetical protein [Halobacillus litoralis]|uniref:hypothetical protein n=1 Tax=Halobacillus litoralis TaxID=45668 RepID=UPI001CFD6D7F|nr:hypothetical protein [Halobacillus litoralis]